MGVAISSLRLPHDSSAFTNDHSVKEGGGIGVLYK